MGLISPSVPWVVAAWRTRLRRLQSLASEKDCGNPLAMSAMGTAWENYIPYAMSLPQQVRYYAGEPVVSPTLIA